MHRDNSWQTKVRLCYKIQVGEALCLFVWGCKQQEVGWRVTYRSWNQTPTLVMTHECCISASQFKGVSTDSKDLISEGWLFSLLHTQPHLTPIYVTLRREVPMIGFQWSQMWVWLLSKSPESFPPFWRDYFSSDEMAMHNGMTDNTLPYSNNGSLP